MSMFDNLKQSLGGGKGRVPPNAALRITQEGRSKLVDGNSDPRARVLAALEARGSSNLNEIAQASHLNRGQVERLIPSMINNGYVQIVSSQTVDED